MGFFVASFPKILSLNMVPGKANKLTYTTTYAEEFALCFLSSMIHPEVTQLWVVKILLQEKTIVDFLLVSNPSAITSELRYENSAWHYDSCPWKVKHLKQILKEED